MALLRRNPEGRPRVLRKDRTGANPLTIGVLVLLGALLVTYFGFTKNVPFSRGFQFKAVFPSANSIRLNSPVRVAGVNVGTVVKVQGQDGTNNALVTMEMKDEGLPVHKDARLKIRPRIFLEGNFFVDLRPGTPSSPAVSDGDTIPVAQTATPVQLDQLLTSLQADTRKSLQTALQSLGSALTAKPTAAQDAAQPSFTRGKSAAEALNSAIDYGESALKNGSIVNQALQGSEQSDLTGLVQGLSQTGEKLAGSEQQLGDLIDNFNTTMAAIASQQDSVRAAIRELGPTVRKAFVSLGALDDALPNVRAFSLEATPGVRQTQATIDALTPWIPPTRALVSKPEAQALLNDAQPVIASLAKATTVTIPLLKQGDLLAKCVTKVILPAGDIKLADGPFSTGKENYKEFWYAMVGLTGEGQNFDGNGSYVRFQTGGGSNAVRMKGPKLQGGQTLYGNAAGQPLGTRPAWNGGVKPPYRPDAACYKQQVPDLNTPDSTGPSDAG